MSRCCHVETVVLVLLLVLLVASPGLAAAFTIGGGRIVVETSALAGESVGVESSTFSRYRAVTEVGLHWEGEDVRWEGGFSGGLLLYGALGNDDLRVGVRPRLRYRFHPDWSTDLSAGLLFAAIEGEASVSETGFTGGVALNYRDWLSLKTDCHVVDVRDRPIYGVDVPSYEEGKEVSLYGGVGFIGQAGWWATALEVAGFAVLIVLFIASGGAY